MARLDSARCSYSLASRRQRAVQAMLRSTTHRGQSGTKPGWSGPRYPGSAHGLPGRGHCGSRRASSSRAPCCSDQSAPTTTAPRQPSLGVHHRQPLAPGDPFSPIDAALAAGFGRPHRLAVDHSRTRLGLAGCVAAVLGAQGGVEPLLGAGLQPQVVVVVHKGSNAWSRAVLTCEHAVLAWAVRTLASARSSLQTRSTWTVRR